MSPTSFQTAPSRVNAYIIVLLSPKVNSIFETKTLHKPYPLPVISYDYSLFNSFKIIPQSFAIFYFIPICASVTDATIPAKVAISAPANV